MMSSSPGFLNPSQQGEAKSPDQTRLAIASLAACTAVALGESQESFLPKFEEALKEVWHHLRDESTVSNAGALETLMWTKELIQHLQGR